MTRYFDIPGGLVLELEDVLEGITGDLNREMEKNLREVVKDVYQDGAADLSTAVVEEALNVLDLPLKLLVDELDRAGWDLRRRHRGGRMRRVKKLA